MPRRSLSDEIGRVLTPSDAMPAPARDSKPSLLLELDGIKCGVYSASEVTSELSGFLGDPEAARGFEIDDSKGDGYGEVASRRASLDLFDSKVDFDEELLLRGGFSFSEGEPTLVLVCNGNANEVETDFKL